jgi:hypothetical protein
MDAAAPTEVDAHPVRGMVGFGPKPCQLFCNTETVTSLLPSDTNSDGVGVPRA